MKLFRKKFWKKKNETIINAFYVSDEVIGEPTCVEETFYEVEKDKEYDAFLRFLMANRERVKPIYYENEDKQEVLLFDAKNLKEILPSIKSERIMQRCKEMIEGKVRKCHWCGVGILDKYATTYRSLSGMVGSSTECCICRGIDDKGVREIRDMYNKRGTKRTQLRLLKHGI